MIPLSSNITFPPVWQTVSSDQLRRPAAAWQVKNDATTSLRREVHRRRPPAPLLPRDYAGLYTLLRARPSLRTELVDAGLEVWRRGRGRWFAWRGRRNSPKRLGHTRTVSCRMMILSS